MQEGEFRTVQRALNYPEPKTNRYGQLYWHGHLDNLSVWFTEGIGMTIRGSICKYHFGNNFESLGLAETSTAFEKLGDELQIRTSNLKLTRIDFAVNLVMDYPVECYLSRLSTSPYYPSPKQYRKHGKLQTVSFENTLRSKKAYNKIDEAIFSKERIPIPFLDTHLLRFETSILKAPHKRFKKQPITADLLNDKAFYLQMLNYWKSEFNTIHKTHLPMSTGNSIKKPSDKLKLFAALYIESIGIENAMLSVEDDKALNRMKSKYAYSNTKSMIRATANKFSKGSDLVEELNSKVIAIEP